MTVVSILYAFDHTDGTWKRERFQGITEARRVAYYGERSGVLTPVRIVSEKYRKGRTDLSVNWDRVADGPISDWIHEHLTDVPNPYPWIDDSEVDRD